MSPMYDYKYLLLSDQSLMDGGAEYSYTSKGNVVNFGMTQPDLAKAGKFGLHIVITTKYETTMTACEIWIVHGSGATPTTRLVGRYFAIADMLAGKHFFIPCSPGLLQYAALHGTPATGNPGSGKMTAWFGPDEDGTE